MLLCPLAASAVPSPPIPRDLQYSSTMNSIIDAKLRRSCSAAATSAAFTSGGTLTLTTSVFVTATSCSCVKNASVLPSISGMDFPANKSSAFGALCAKNHGARMCVRAVTKHGCGQRHALRMSIIPLAALAHRPLDERQDLTSSVRSGSFGTASSCVRASVVVDSTCRATPMRPLGCQCIVSI